MMVILTSLELGVSPTRMGLALGFGQLHHYKNGSHGRAHRGYFYSFSLWLLMFLVVGKLLWLLHAMVLQGSQIDESQSPMSFFSEA